MNELNLFFWFYLLLWPLARDALEYRGEIRAPIVIGRFLYGSALSLFAFIMAVSARVYFYYVFERVFY